MKKNNYKKPGALAPGFKNKLIKILQAAGSRPQAASRAGGPAGGKLHLTSMGFYGTTNYDSGLPTMPRQTTLENTRATRPRHIGAHEILSRWRIAPVPKKKEHEAKRTTIRSCLFSIKKIKATGRRRQATGSRLQAAGGRQQAVTDL